MPAIDRDFDRTHLWHPYTSTDRPLPCYPVAGAEGNEIVLEDGTRLVDGMASWWCAIHGYNVPALNEAVKSQCDAMSHVMFGGITHRPAIALSKRLLGAAPERLEKIFLCDSGSVAVEVAIKMAVQYWQGRGIPRKTRLLSLRHAYHGDTLGAMSASDPVNGMHAMFAGILPQNHFLDALPPGFERPISDAERDQVEQSLAVRAGECAALIVEPVLQGAGGMRIYNPQWLTLLRELCDRYDLLLIFDEIATGFGRTGRLFALEHATAVPDILCLGKALTGGYMTLAATLASDEVARGVGASPAGVFMHGPTFMANPLACAVACASFDLLLESGWQRRVLHIEEVLRDRLLPLASLPGVRDARVLGAVGVLEMRAAVDVAAAQALFVRHGVWIRPFGRLLYVMPPYSTTDDQLERLTGAMAACAAGDA